LTSGAHLNEEHLEDFFRLDGGSLMQRQAARAPQHDLRRRERERFARRQLAVENDELANLSAGAADVHAAVFVAREAAQANDDAVDRLARPVFDFELDRHRQVSAGLDDALRQLALEVDVSFRKQKAFGSVVVRQRCSDRTLRQLGVDEIERQRVHEKRLCERLQQSSLVENRQIVLQALCRRGESR
jgi:hypothetical protein